MKTATVFLGVLALAAASLVTKNDRRKADKDLLEKQKSLLELVYRVHQPVQNVRIQEAGETYSIYNSVDRYTNPDVVKKFWTTWKYGMLPKDEIFSVLDRGQVEEVIHLFDILYYAKDWDTFYKTASWARLNINPGQFVYAVSIAVLHRDDMRGLMLPPLYEIYPQLFVDAEVIQNALYMVRAGKEVKEIVVPYNHSVRYPGYMYEDDTKTVMERWSKYKHGGDRKLKQHHESRLNYFTEDVALSQYHTYFHLLNPYWMDTKYNHNWERRGEWFYHYHQQLLARYQMERVSNDLLEVEYLDLHQPIEVGYNPNLRYPNGEAFPARPDHMEGDIHPYTSYEYSLVKDFERRIVDAIDLGYVVDDKGEKVELTTERGIEILGRMIESAINTVNHRYYGDIYKVSLRVLGHITDPQHYHRVAPGVLDHYETVLRDPVYYRLLKSINYIFYRYKAHLPRYQREELYFPGIKVDSLDVDKLVTYFDNFDIDITTAVPLTKSDKDLTIKARQYRLNHKPFTYKVNVVADKATDVMVRVFIGPKYDAEGHVLDIQERRDMMVELDRFPYKVNAGQNTINRNSKDFYYTTEDITTYRTMYKNVLDALEGKTEFYVDDDYFMSLYPDRLVLPKGKRGGMPFVFFVAVTPYEQKEQKEQMMQKKEYVNTWWNQYYYQDRYALGYPFDRVIDETQFYVSNFYEKEVIVFHKPEDVNNSI